MWHFNKLWHNLCLYSLFIDWPLYSFYPQALCNHLHPELSTSFLRFILLERCKTSISWHIIQIVMPRQWNISLRWLLKVQWALYIHLFLLVTLTIEKTSATTIPIGQDTHISKTTFASIEICYLFSIDMITWG